MEIDYLDENEILMKELTRENDWEKISKLNLCQDDLIKYKNKLNWETVLRNRKIIHYTHETNEVVLKLLDQLIKEEIIDLSINSMSISLCSYLKASNLEFIKKYKDKLNINIIIKHCGFETKELAQLITIQPKIGMGATYVSEHNLYPYTIVKINKAGNQIEIQKDIHEKVEGFDYSNQSYNIIPDQNGRILRVTLRKNGDWGVVNSSSKIFLGGRQCYINPDFI